MQVLALAGPHTSLLDGPAVSSWLRSRGFHRVLFAVDPDYARHLLWRPLLLTYGLLQGGHRMVPVDSRRPYGLRRLLRAHGEGWDVLIFPQGTGISNATRAEQMGYSWLASRILRENPDTPVVRIIVDHTRWWPRCRFESVHSLPEVTAHA